MKKYVWCLVLIGVLAPGWAWSQSQTGFRSPSGNIACEVYDGVLRCDIRDTVAPLPARPKDCELDWGNFVGMEAKGRAQRLCAGDTIFAQQPILAYGKTWNYQGFTCISERTGVTCRNRDQRGWLINKVQQKLF